MILAGAYLGFRYRDRVFRLIVTTTGKIVSEESF
jgi:hypothetical protein